MRKGFTLIELLVVIAIIGILGSLLMGIVKGRTGEDALQEGRPAVIINEDGVEETVYYED